MKVVVNGSTWLNRFQNTKDEVQGVVIRLSSISPRQTLIDPCLCRDNLGGAVEMAQPGVVSTLHYSKNRNQNRSPNGAFSKQNA